MTAEHLKKMSWQVKFISGYILQNYKAESFLIRTVMSTGMLPLEGRCTSGLAESADMLLQRNATPPCTALQHAPVPHLQALLP